jgi:hypothetical protein
MDKKRRADEIIKGLRAEYEPKKKEEAAIFPDQS